jgi:hypothetical protein
MARFTQHSQALANARVNADASGETWAIFCDPSGAWNSERLGSSPTGPTWAGVTREIVTPINASQNFQRFAVAYRDGLRKAVREDTLRYPWYKGNDTDIDTVASSILYRIARARSTGVTDSVSPGAKGFKYACKALGIRWTQKAMNAYITTPDPIAVAAPQPTLVA